MNPGSAARLYKVEVDEEFALYLAGRALGFSQHKAEILIKTDAAFRIETRSADSIGYAAGPWVGRRCTTSR